MIKAMMLSIAIAPPAQTQTVDLPDALHWPNGIAVAQDGALIVGSITAPTVARYAAGEWSLQDVGTEAVFSVTSLTLDGPRGLLWGTSPAFLERARGRSHGLFALDGESLEPVLERSLPDGGFANDTELDPDGRLLVTDSTNGRLLRYDPEDETFTTLVEDDRLRPAGSVGAAGVTVGPDGSVYVTNYDAGTLFRVYRGRMAPVDLPRRLFNPDGLAMHGADLILIEGAAASGDGRVLRILDPHRAGVRPVITLADGLESPVNLTVDGDGVVWVSESRIRRVLHGESEDPQPPFRVVKLTLGSVDPSSP